MENTSATQLVSVVRLQPAIGDGKNAGQTLKEAIKVDDSSLLVIVTRAECLIANERYSEALK